MSRLAPSFRYHATPCEDRSYAFSHSRETRAVGDYSRDVVSVLSGVPRETRFERDQMFEPSTFDRGDLKEVQSKFRAMEFESISS